MGLTYKTKTITVFSRIQAAACIKILPLFMRLQFKGGLYLRAACIKFLLIQCFESLLKNGFFSFPTRKFVNINGKRRPEFNYLPLVLCCAACNKGRLV